MKRICLIIFVILIIATGIKAQNVDDALRYSQIFYGGSARFNSMGGAFTALGGDISTLNQNPAGLGVFRSSEITLSPQLYNTRTTADFNGKFTDNLYNFNINQIGFVGNIISHESGLISLNIAYSYNKMNNLSQSARIQGVSNSSSMADYWAGLGNSGNNGAGTNFHDLQGAEGLAFDAWVMDTVTGSGGKKYGTVFNNYGDNASSAYGQTIRRLIANDGYIGEHSFSIGGNYSDKFFFGATFGITQLRYTSDYEHLESTDNALPTAFKNFTYIDHYEDKGTGYSVKFGAIYKPVDAVRLGLAFHTPTWYKIDEYYYNDVTANFTDGGHYEFSSDPSRFNYALATPFRVLAGIGVQIQKIALLSADYEFVDYSTAKFSQTGDGYDYTNKNDEIKNSLKPTSNFRLGGELRLSNVYLRTGYGYYGIPFTAGDANSNLHYTSISAGVGIREQNFSIDFSYTNFNYSENYLLYPVATGIDPATANLGTSKNVFTLTLGYRFGI
jgi:hypothetical protein